MPAPHLSRVPAQRVEHAAKASLSYPTVLLVGAVFGFAALLILAAGCSPLAAVGLAVLGAGSTLALVGIGKGVAAVGRQFLGQGRGPDGEAV